MLSSRLRATKLINFIAKLSFRQLNTMSVHFYYGFSQSTGPMHIGATLKVPAVSLFTLLPACLPTLWGPQGKSRIFIYQQKVFARKNARLTQRNAHLGGLMWRTGFTQSSASSRSPAGTENHLQMGWMLPETRWDFLGTSLGWGYEIRRFNPCFSQALAEDSGFRCRE